MNEHEQDSFEAELRQLRPARLPEGFVERLAAARPGVAPHPARPASRPQPVSWRRVLRWLAPATAAALSLVALASWLNRPALKTPVLAPIASAPPVLQADDVELDRQLIGSFEAIATLPSGEPVRVRCREWMDEVVLRDTARGVAIQQRTPRFEVIPVSFETF